MAIGDDKFSDDDFDFDRFKNGKATYFGGIQLVLPYGSASKRGKLRGTNLYSTREHFPTREGKYYRNIAIPISLVRRFKINENNPQAWRLFYNNNGFYGFFPRHKKIEEPENGEVQIVPYAPTDHRLKGTYYHWNSGQKVPKVIVEEYRKAGRTGLVPWPATLYCGRIPESNYIAETNLAYWREDLHVKVNRSNQTSLYFQLPTALSPCKQNSFLMFTDSLSNIFLVGTTIREDRQIGDYCLLDTNPIIFPLELPT